MSRTGEALLDEEQTAPTVLRFYYEGRHRGELVIDDDPQEADAAIRGKMAELGIEHAAVNVTGDPEYYSGKMWAFFPPGSNNGKSDMPAATTGGAI